MNDRREVGAAIIAACREIAALGVSPERIRALWLLLAPACEQGGPGAGLGVLVLEAVQDPAMWYPATKHVRLQPGKVVAVPGFNLTCDYSPDAHLFAWWPSYASRVELPEAAPGIAALAVAAGLLTPEVPK